MTRPPEEGHWKKALVCAGGAGALLLAAGMPALAGETPVQAEQDQLALFLDPGQMVEAATRSPKPISQVAENVTIITAAEIEAMNAHNVSEVLNRVTGLFEDGSAADFGNRSSIHIQGSGYDHVLVLLDGLRWGYVSYDYPETNTIPVQIIKRIEVIKGPASSTWGSALGGVVNIITQDAGTTARPKGMLSGSYGEHATSDLRLDAAGLAGPVGYYLYAGNQESDGIRNSRFLDSQTFYGKLTLPLPSGMALQGSMGYSQPDYAYFTSLEWDDQWQLNDRAFHANLDFTAPLSKSLTLNLAAHYLEYTLTDIGQWMSTGETYLKLEYEGQSTTTSGRLVWAGESQTVVLGAESEWRESTDRDLVAPYTAPTLDEDLWALFVNDTIRWDKLTVIPGLRYDNLSTVNEDLLSPSLGLTYQMSVDTLLRGSVGRGFRKPVPGEIEGDPWFHIVNPDLDSETVWSYQAGVETSKWSYARLKATLFDHRSTDTWTRDPETWAVINGDDYERQGLELVAMSASFNNFSVDGGWMYELLKPDQGDDTTMATLNLLLKYDDSRWRFQLFGHYAWLGDHELPNVSTPTIWEGKMGTFLWDAVAGYRFTAPGELQGDVFAALHNIFNEDQYTSSFQPNAPRWVEAGVRFKF